MNCPVCKNISLAMSERNGIEIDYCPQCRGVWLDRGELDKIIERSAADQRPVTSSTHAYRHKEDSCKQHDKHYPHSDNYHHKRKSFLSELFD